VPTKYAPYAPYGVGSKAFLVSAPVHNWVYSSYFDLPDWNALSVR